jgi:hypothetical protein
VRYSHNSSFPHFIDYARRSATKIKTLALATILAVSFAIGAKAETVILSGEDVTYEINLPDATIPQGDGQQTALQPEQPATPDPHTTPDPQATPGFKDPAPSGTVTLNPDWSLPGHM